MSGWQEKKLGEFIDVINGFAFKSENFIDEPNESTLPIIKIKNVANGDTNLNGTQYHHYTNNLSKYVVENGDVLIALTGNHPQAQSQVVGMASRFKLKTNALLNQRVAKVIAKDEKRLGLDFIYFFLKDPNTHQYLASQSSGSANQANISKKDIEGIPFFPPSEAEQKSIASVLSSLDDKIDLLHRQNKTLEAMAETLFRQWFVEGVGDWESGKVSDLIDVLSGFAFKSTSFVENGIYRLMTIKAVQDGYLETNNADRIAEIPANMPSYCNLQEGDILLSLTGNVGRCCLVDDEKLLLNQRVAKLRPKNERDHAFAYVMFRQMSMRSMLEEMAKGTAQANLSPVEMASMAIQIPPDDVLSEFSLAATPTLKKLLFNKREIKTLEKIRDSLLPKLMSGEVRVEHA
jgi:type I restriction enzyme S subunit